MKAPSTEARKWMQVSLATVQARRMRFATSVNGMLQQAADDPALRRLRPALLLWAAENLLQGAEFHAAIDASTRLRQEFGGTEWGDDSFLVEAQAYRRLGDIDAALRTYEAAAHGGSARRSRSA